MRHFGEKTKINLDFGRFCIIFVLKFEGRRDGVKAGKGQGGGDTMWLRWGYNVFEAGTQCGCLGDKKRYCVYK